MNRAAFREVLAPSDARDEAYAPRGERLPRFVGAPANGDRLLDALKLAIVGVGSVGRALVAHLSRLTPATLWIVDPGRFKSTSYLTHSCLPPGHELGAPKALSASRVACSSCAWRNRSSPQKRS